MVTTLAIGWLVFLGTHTVLSGRLWLWQLVDLVPPVVFVAVPVALVVAALVGSVDQPWPYLIAGAAGVAGYRRSGLNLRFPRRVPPCDGAQVFRVVSWNTEHWHQDGDPCAFYAFLKARDADIYLLQEYMRCVDDRPLELDDRVRLRTAFPGYHIAARGELVTLSRFPIVATPSVGPAGRLRSGDPWLASFDLAKVLRTDVVVGGDVVSVYNVHIPTQYKRRDNPLSRRFYLDLRERHRHRRSQLHGLESDVDNNGNPLVVGGDFNSTTCMRELTGMFRRCVSANSATRLPYPWSWRIAGLPLWQLDWMFNRGVRVRHYGFVDAEGLSDHRAQEMSGFVS